MTASRIEFIRTGGKYMSNEIDLSQSQTSMWYYKQTIYVSWNHSYISISARPIIFVTKGFLCPVTWILYHKCGINSFDMRLSSMYTGSGLVKNSPIRHWHIYLWYVSNRRNPKFVDSSPLDLTWKSHHNPYWIVLIW